MKKNYGFARLMEVLEAFAAARVPEEGSQIWEEAVLPKFAPKLFTAEKLLSQRKVRLKRYSSPVSWELGSSMTPPEACPPSMPLLSKKGSLTLEELLPSRYMVPSGASPLYLSTMVTIRPMIRAARDSTMAKAHTIFFSPAIPLFIALPISAVLKLRAAVKAARRIACDYTCYSCSARALASSMTFCWTLPGASS